jgi:hypothetical protein
MLMYVIDSQRVLLKKIVVQFQTHHSQGQYYTGKYDHVFMFKLCSYKETRLKT